MRIDLTARKWKMAKGSTLIVIAMICAWGQVTRSQATQHDTRIQKLFSSDAAVRSAAKADLLQHPDPALLPALLKELPSAKGTNQADLLDILAKYDDARKIPVFLAVRMSGDQGGEGQIDEQLSRLGQPAADALTAHCTTSDENYAHWAAGVLSWMHQIGVRALIDAVQSNDACKHEMGEQGLLYMSDADDVARADTLLASDAAIDPDERIRGAARNFFASFKGNEENFDGSGIVEALIAAYQKAPAATMVRIAQMLSEPERPRVTRFMRAAVHSPNPEVQKIANDYLTRFPLKAAPGAEGSSNPQSPEEKIKFINGVIDSPQGANEKILPLLSDQDAKVRAAAARAIGGLNAPSMSGADDPAGDAETTLPALRKAAKDPSPQVRAAAVGALGDIRSTDDAELVAAALKDSDTAVQLEAVTALQQIPTDSAVPDLTQIYRNSQSTADMKFQVIVALRTICSPDTTPLLLEVLQASNGSPSLDLVEGLQCTLTKRADSAAFAPILKALQANDTKAAPGYFVVEGRLMDALAATKNPGAFEPLTEFAKSQNALIRRDAAGALGMLGDRRAIPLLAGLLRDPDYEVVRSAAAALTRFSDFPAPPELIATLNNPNTGADINVLGALVASRDPKVTDAMIAAMPKNPSVLYWMGKMHDTRAVPALISYMQNPAHDTENRATAAASLGQLGDERAVAPLIANLAEDNGQIVMQVSSALAMLKDRRAIEPLKQAYARWSTGQRQNAETVKVWISSALQKFGEKP